jgi:holo-[acyl-carrier protein] synthase
MNLATGVDLLEIERLRGAIQRHGMRLLERLFTREELACLLGEGQADPQQALAQAASLAARFAAKEAVAKALGTGIGAVAWQEIEVLRGPSGEPQLHLHGAAQRLAQARGLESWSLSLSHTDTHALAFVVAQ